MQCLKMILKSIAVKFCNNYLNKVYWNIFLLRIMFLVLLLGRKVMENLLLQTMIHLITWISKNSQNSLHVFWWDQGKISEKYLNSLLSRQRKSNHNPNLLENPMVKQKRVHKNKNSLVRKILFHYLTAFFLIYKYKPQ